MEFWCWETVILRDLVRRSKTGKPLPPKLLRAIKAGYFYVGTLGRWGPLEYLTRSFVDLYLHSAYPRKGHVERVMARIRKEIPVLPVYPEDCFPNNFSYIFSDEYEMSFYGYDWAKRFAADAFLAHQETGRLVNPIVGRKFRREMLEVSRSRTMKKGYIAFRGRIPSTKVMLKLMRII